MAQHHGIHFGMDMDIPPIRTKVPQRQTRDVEDYPLLDSGLDEMHGQELDFICLPLMSGHGFEPFGRSARLLKVTSWCSMVVGKISTWHGDVMLDYDSEDPEIASLSCEVLKKEIAYAAHSTLPAVMIDLPTKPSPNLARIIMSTLLKSMYLNIWVRVPMMLGDSIDEEDNSAWLAWNSLRTMCHNHNRLNVILEVTENLPKKSICERWVAEPLKGLIMPTSLFIFDDNSNLGLSPPHYDLLMLMHKHKSQIIFTGEVHPLILASGLDLRYYKNYIVNTKAQIEFSPQEQEETPYFDYLQAPLQPLMDNLESQTYEVFEKDPVKYVRYQEAAAAALEDLMGVITDRPIVVMVVGAGRGPLVKGALTAAEEVGAKIKMYAVEKNPNAIVTLKGMLRERDWSNKVEIIECDMRVWESPDKADIMISELLGSFGDNELSPECLDGAERFLNKETGIMIPQSYRSYVAPLQSHKLHTDVLAYDDVTHIETAYVVKIHSGYVIAPPKQCFEYIHPKPPAPYPQSNDRMLSMTFEVEDDALCHGFAGYFHATLYKDIYISIHPDTFSDGMFSWFPIYFPIKTPMLLRKGDKLTAVFWRVTGNGKVWYEWCISTPSPAPVHNPNGRSYWVGL
eukprot:TRINITY_DN8230_c0_g1_i1.p1 TRINITY_DN8230_c0_g1~~TRINITY_DN8230_c0_g1_i1.p1  ORF type:complete len:625 (+),score=264.68 TRINITY_DN8230_c0_g1_i1:44-1918(+)